MNKNLVTAYDIIEERRSDDLNSNVVVLKHKKTGARVLVLENDDDNKTFYIGFRTPPVDSTGVAHIIEHTVLCGSEEFPLKDPFIELAKGSLNTFLNAMTYPDKTVYPVCSCNDKDFQNLMHVYLDAVFRPNIYKEEKIFKQEGWHYEMEEEDGPLTINGVVYNEMKGAFSSPDDVLDRKIQNSLYPDSTYGVESGGDPENIPDLTYEGFLDFHKRYYHPSNSYIYLYGDGDMGERLKWIDEHYLSNYDCAPVESYPTFQQPFDSLKLIKDYYPITDDEKEEDNTYLSYNYVVDKTTNIELGYAFQVLDYALCQGQGTPLKQALLDAEIGTEVYSSYINGILQPYYSIVAKNANEADAEKFEKIINDTLKDIVKKGFDKNALYAGLNILEFKYKEADFGNYPKGLVFGLNAFDSWLYDDNMPLDMIECGEVFKKLKSLIETDYYEKLIETYLLNNNHKSFLQLLPKKGLQEENEKALADKLEAYKQTLSKEEIKKIIEDNKALKEYQSEGEKPEDLAKIPKLKREDLGKKARKIVNEEKKIGDVDALYHDIFTSKILYLNLMFDLGKLPADVLPYLSILALVVGSVDTEKRPYSLLGYEINKITGGLSVYANQYAKADDCNDYSVTFGLKFKCLYDNIEQSFDLAKEILFNSKLDDKKRLKEIISENKSVYLSMYSSAGHVLASSRAQSYISESSLVSDYLDGINFYNVLCDLEENFDEKADELISSLKLLLDFVLDKKKLFVDITADQEGYNLATNEISSFYELLSDSAITLNGDLPKPEIKNEAFTSSAMIQYVCRAGNFKNKGLEYTGALRVLKTLMGYEYLWNEVRVKGGAYGCMSLYNRNGNCYFVSYRDPNLENTIKIYEQAADYIESFDCDDDTLTKYIIGTISSMDTPLSPYKEGARSAALYLAGMTYDQLQKERDQVLNCKPEDIRKLAGHIRAFMDDKVLCVVGNAGKIKENEGLFKDIKPLA